MSERRPVGMFVVAAVIICGALVAVTAFFSVPTSSGPRSTSLPEAATTPDPTPTEPATPLDTTTEGELAAGSYVAGLAGLQITSGGCTFELEGAGGWGIDYAEWMGPVKPSSVIGYTHWRVSEYPWVEAVWRAVATPVGGGNYAVRVVERELFLSVGGRQEEFVNCSPSPEDLVFGVAS